MSEFICVRVYKKTGINWCVETREYELRRKWWYRFLKIRTSFVIDFPGEFYFSENRKLLPQQGTKESGSGLSPFTGKKYIDWVLENTNGRVRLYCRREYSLDFDDFEIALGFADEADAMAFKLRWL